MTGEEPEASEKGPAEEPEGAGHEEPELKRRGISEKKLKKFISCIMVYYSTGCFCNIQVQIATVCITFICAHSGYYGG